MTTFQKGSLPTNKTGKAENAVKKNISPEDEVVLPPAQSSKQEIDKLEIHNVIQDPEKLLASLLNQKPGIAFGVDHRTEEIYSYLADRAGLFKEGGVKIAFMEIVLSKDTTKVQDFLEKGDAHGLKDYLDTRSYSPTIREYYFNLLQSLHKSSIEIMGIDKPTGEKRIKESNPHWIQVIKENRPDDETSKYIIIGGSSHFGHVWGPGVNIELGIPNIKFYVGKGPNEESIELPRSASSVELFLDRPVADYAIMLPRKESKKDREDELIK